MAERVMEALEQVEQEIQEQMRQFSDVDEERLQIRVAKIQTKMLNEKNALTPVGKLPDEMLLKVFKHCVEGVAEIHYHNGRAPIHLWTAIIHTSARWRLLGLQHGDMWSEINLMWPATTIDRFLTFSGKHSLHLFLPQPRLGLLQPYTHYLKECSLRLSGVSISSDAPPSSNQVGVVEQLLMYVIRLRLPVLRTFVAIREPSMDRPIVISRVISPALKVLVLAGFKHPTSQVSYAGLTSIRIHEVIFKRLELLALLHTNRSLQTLELSSGLRQTHPKDHENLERLEHNISTLSIGPLHALDVEVLFDKVDFTSLSNLRFHIREGIRVAQLPAGLQPFVKDPISLRLLEDRSKNLIRLVFQSHPYRTYEVTTLASLSVGRPDVWGPILSQLSLSSSSRLSTLEIDIHHLPDADLLALFLRTCCSELKHLILSTAEMEPFVDAISTDIGLLSTLETLDLGGTEIIPKKFVEWLENREREYPRLRTLILPNRFAWDVIWPRLFALAEDLVIQPC
ncbi:hypothetical protein SISSUDRAFT_1066957 [Sistotremastrum suecicum HHB10207 ss-3]|uniref:F-box domain-containing protein n=1 Tax=Sistotremastrum suecicum HHB10207 ss-3 TaxID=1314776 RepID=A0A165XPI0_9AGAM|nr:hypothetical protein SISSUDRAFT_1066957 [Sistotremastrum suecicum HHB10207 ss-3]